MSRRNTSHTRARANGVAEDALLDREKQNKAEKVSLKTLFFTFFKIGLFTFGGGYAMLSLIEEECVGRRGWMTKQEMLDMVALAESTPGPVAINSATYLGCRLRGVAGACAATGGVVLPSFVILFLISLVFEAFLKIKPVAAAFRGIQVAVGLLVLRAGLSLLKGLPKKPFPLIFAGAVTVALLCVNVFAWSVSSLWCILIGAVAGLTAFALNKAQGEVGATEPSAKGELEEDAAKALEKEGEL